MFNYIYFEYSIDTVLDIKFKTGKIKIFYMGAILKFNISSTNHRLSDVVFLFYRMILWKYIYYETLLLK